MRLASLSQKGSKKLNPIARFPGRFVGQALANPHDGMQGVRELERAVKELGLSRFYASPFRYGTVRCHGLRWEWH